MHGRPAARAVALTSGRGQVAAHQRADEQHRRCELFLVVAHEVQHAQRALRSDQLGGPATGPRLAHHDGQSARSSGCLRRRNLQVQQRGAQRHAHAGERARLLQRRQGRPVSLIAMVGASNELPEGVELEALFDRFLVRFWVPYLTEPKNVRTLLSAQQPRARATIRPTGPIRSTSSIAGLATNGVERSKAINELASCQIGRRSQDSEVRSDPRERESSSSAGFTTLAGGERRRGRDGGEGARCGRGCRRSVACRAWGRRHVGLKPRLGPWSISVAGR